MRSVGNGYVCVKGGEERIKGGKQKVRISNYWMECGKRNRASEKRVRSVRYRKHMATGCHPLFGIALVRIFRNETCRFYPDQRLRSPYFHGEADTGKRTI